MAESTAPPPDGSHEVAVEEAVEAFRATENQKNCAQSVMLFTVRRLGGDEDVLGLARYLGSGMGRSGNARGALTGAVVSFGIRDALKPKEWAGRADEGCAQIQELIADFRSEFGETDCAELTGCELSSEAGRKRFSEEGIRESQCVQYVRWVSDRMARYL